MKILFLLLLLLTSCAGSLSNLTDHATQGAIDVLTSNDNANKLSSLATHVVSSARDEALGSTTNQEIQNLISDSGQTSQAEINKIISVFQQQLVSSIRLVLDEVFSKTTFQEVGNLRENLIGQPFRDDLNRAILEASPQLNQAIQLAIQTSFSPIKIEADVEAQKWKPIALTFAIGCVFLLISLILGFFLALRSHRKVIEAVTSMSNQKLL
jgi:hypothetical protein